MNRNQANRLHLFLAFSLLTGLFLFGLAPNALGVSKHNGTEKAERERDREFSQISAAARKNIAKLQADQKESLETVNGLKDRLEKAKALDKVYRDSIDDTTKLRLLEEPGTEKAKQLEQRLTDLKTKQNENKKEIDAIATAHDDERQKLGARQNEINLAMERLGRNEERRQLEKDFNKRTEKLNEQMAKLQDDLKQAKNDAASAQNGGGSGGGGPSSGGGGGGGGGAGGGSGGPATTLVLGNTGSVTGSRPAESFGLMVTRVPDSQALDLKHIDLTLKDLRKSRPGGPPAGEAPAPNL